MSALGEGGAGSKAGIVAASATKSAPPGFGKVADSGGLFGSVSSVLAPAATPANGAAGSLRGGTGSGGTSGGGAATGLRMGHFLGQGLQDLDRNQLDRLLELHLSGIRDVVAARDRLPH